MIKRKKLTSDEVIKAYIEKLGNVWTPEEADLVSVSRQHHAHGEGPGEKAIRSRLGLDINNISSKNKTDITEYSANAECKYLNKFTEPFKLNAEGTDAWNSVGQESIFHSTRVLWQREVTVSKIKSLSEQPLMIIDKMKFSNVVGYNFLCIISNYGFFSIPRREFDDVFEFYKISQSTPRYKINLTYIENKLSHDISIDPLIEYIQNQRMISTSE